MAYINYQNSKLITIKRDPYHLLGLNSRIRDFSISPSNI